MASLITLCVGLAPGGCCSSTRFSFKLRWLLLFSELPLPSASLCLPLAACPLSDEGCLSSPGLSLLWDREAFLPSGLLSLLELFSLSLLHWGIYCKWTIVSQTPVLQEHWRFGFMHMRTPRMSSQFNPLYPSKQTPPSVIHSKCTLQ